MKPTVVFRPIENISILAGCPAVVFTLNHPTRGAGVVWAGWVINVWEDDNHNIFRFETEDAYYVVAGGDDDASVECVAE